MLERLRVFVADEDPDSRVATRKAIQRAQLDVAGETGHGTPAVSAALEARPDVLLVAFEEPLAIPMDTIVALANALPDTPLIVYSTVETPEAIRRAMVLGARDFLPRPVQAERLIQSITTALEQEERKQMRRAGGGGSTTARGSVITVAGAKGGIGKSIVSVNLAIALKQETGKSVAIIDADTQFGDVATMLDLQPKLTVAELLREPAAIDRARIQEFVTRHPSGVDVLAGSLREEPWEATPLETVSKVIDTLAQLYEFVIVDTAGSFNPFLKTCMENASLTIVVTSGEVSSIRDTRLALTRLDGWNIDPARVRVVLNRTHRATGVRVDDVEKAIDHALFWEIPHDGRVSEGVQLGVPVVTEGANSPAAREINALARRIAGTRRSLTEEREQPASGWMKFKNPFANLRGKDGSADVPVTRVSDERE